MHDDELRARQQLEEIKMVLKDSKSQIRNYKLPVIPDSYYVELNEATSAIKEIVKELDKKPIVIKILNIRVDTARDLVFKIYNKTNDMIKMVNMAENIIVYGNRYRSTYEEIDIAMDKAEELFKRGKYKVVEVEEVMLLLLLVVIHVHHLRKKVSLVKLERLK